MNPVRQIISDLGGPAKLARRLQALTGGEITPQAVWSWGKVGSVPSWWLPQLATLAAEDGRTLAADDILALGGRPRGSQGEAA